MLKLLLRPIKKAKAAPKHMRSHLFLSPTFTFTSPSPSPSSLLPTAAAAMHGAAPTNLADATSQKKPALRAKIRRDLRSLPLAQRRQEDAAMQNAVVDSSWFRASRSLCAYISCEALREVDTSRILSEFLHSSPEDNQTQIKRKLYVPWVEDNNSNMRMLRISNMEDLVANSMNILEPSPVDVHGNQREDVLLADNPVDLFILPGLAFDRSGHRIGRGRGYYDVFLKKYQEIAIKRNWKQPLLVALAYSVQVMDEGVIPVTSHDVPIDALVSPFGVNRISTLALERM